MLSFRRVTFVAAIVVVAGTAVSLGRWQVRRLHARLAANRQQLEARAAPPLPLPGPLTLADSNRYASARGHFDTTSQLYLRGRVLDEAPGLDVVTPFDLDSGQRVLWVVRGFVRSPDADTPPDSIAAPALGDVTVTGLLVAAPVLADSGQPLHHLGTTTRVRLDRNTMRHLRPMSLDLYVVASGGTAGPARLPSIPAPQLTDGPHLSYAVQWFGIALAVVCFGVLIIWRGDRQLPPDRAAP